MGENRFNTSDEFVIALKKIVSGLHQPVAGGMVSFAVYEAVQPCQFISGRLLVCEAQERPREALRYDTLTLAEQWVPRERLDEFIAALSRGTIVAGDVSVTAAFSGFSLERGLGTYNNVSGWPEWQGILRTDGRLREYPRDEVVRFGLPPYRSIAHAVNDWVHRRPRNAESNSTEFSGELVVAVPDTRGRLVRAEWVGGTLTVERESHSQDDRALQLQVRFLGDTERPVELITPCPPEVHRAVAPGTESILVYLVHQEAGLLSDRSLGSYQRQREQPPIEVLTLEAEAERDLTGGESEFVEFKPFVKVQDPKEDELERSLVAFANTSGGRLYIGVNDDGDLQGARALKDAVKDGSDQEGALGVLARRLETVIAERIKPERPVFEVHELEFRGYPLLMVRVAKGRKAYSTRREWIYVRRQASNYRASIAEIRDLLAAREEDGRTVVVPSDLLRF